MKISNYKHTTGKVLSCFILLMLFPSLIPYGLSDTNSPTPAKPNDPPEKIKISSQRLVADSNGNNAEFIGNVRARQGQTFIAADSLKIFFSEKNESNAGSAAQSIEKLVATGNVEIKFDNRLAVAQQAVYITAERVLTLTGPGATVTSGENTITGEKITFFRADGRFTVEGGSNSRVKAVILPEESGLE